MYTLPHQNLMGNKANHVLFYGIRNSIPVTVNEQIYNTSHPSSLHFFILDTPTNPLHDNLTLQANWNL